MYFIVTTYSVSSSSFVLTLDILSQGMPQQVGIHNSGEMLYEAYLVSLLSGTRASLSEHDPSLGSLTKLTFH